MNVEERILKLENQNKKLRFFNYLSVMLVSVLFISGFQQQLQLPDIIKAKGFILLDDNNKERAILTIDTTQNINSPKLRFFNEDNKIITSIGANVNSGYLSLDELNQDKTNDSSSVWISGNGFRLFYNEENKISLGIVDKESFLNITSVNNENFTQIVQKDSSSLVQVNIFDDSKVSVFQENFYSEDIYKNNKNIYRMLGGYNKESNEIGIIEIFGNVHNKTRFFRDNNYEETIYLNDKRIYGMFGGYSSKSDKIEFQDVFGTDSNHIFRDIKGLDYNLIGQSKNGKVFTNLGCNDRGTRVWLEDKKESIVLGNQNFLYDTNKSRFGLSISHTKNMLDDNVNYDDILTNNLFLGLYFDPIDNNSYSINSGMTFRINDKYIYKNIYDKNKISTKYFDNNGNLRLSIGNTEIQHSDGTEQITPTSSIYLFNENGEVIDILPR